MGDPRPAGPRLGALGAPEGSAPALEYRRSVRGQPWPGAGTAALAVLSLVYFPFRMALVAFPALLFLSWALRGERGGVRGRTLKGRILSWLLALVLGAWSARRSAGATA